MGSWRGLGVFVETALLMLDSASILLAFYICTYLGCRLEVRIRFYPASLANIYRKRVEFRRAVGCRYEFVFSVLDDQAKPFALVRTKELRHK